MRLFLLAVAAGLLSAGSLFGAPADEVRSAKQDLVYEVPEARHKWTRYLSLANKPPDERARTAAVVRFVLNTLGQSPTMVEVPEVGDLLRADLAELMIDPLARDKLVADGEPYYHVKTRLANGKIVFTDAGHVGLENAYQMRLMTGSAGALTRADWFVWRATTDHYYSLAGVPDTLDGWYKSVGADPKVIVKLLANRGANIFRSGVTQKKRRVSRWQGPLGPVWNTYDSAVNDDPLHDPFRVPDFTGKYDAGEFIASRPNGLHQFGLYNAAGKRQGSVPDNIAKDDSDPHGDGVLVPMLSCVRCHTEGGWKTFNNDMDELLSSLKGYDPQRLRAFYDTKRLNKELKRDQEDYDEACKKACGLTAKEVSEALGHVVRLYGYNTVDADQAMRDLGASDLKTFVLSLDPYLLALLNGKKINRQDWEQSFNEAATLTAGSK